jgi:acyl-CoA reductase-like NAD-dependent aldehyde dehydrogenase
MKIKSINPSTSDVLGEVEVSSNKEITEKVAAARKASKEWREIGLKGRIEYLRKVVKEIEKRDKEFALLTAQEMGMPISLSIHDVHGSIEYFNWYLDNAEKYLSSETVYEDDEMIHKVFYEPIGVAAVITPWNFPLSNFVWGAGQNLVVGNTVVYKTSEECPLCGKLIEEAFKSAGLPDGVFSEVYGAGEAGDFLVHEDINLISFTGSTKTGQHLYKVAGEKFIKAVMELGGSAPGVVFEDANLDKAIDAIYANRFDNCGQICDGLKRLIVHESKFDEVIEKLKTKLESVKIGDATDEETDLGPLVSQRQLETLKEQVKDAIDKGARVAYEGKVPENLSGSFYPPMILIDITPDMKVWNEEVFGPVLPIATFDTEEKAIRMANDTKYGLGGYVFTEDKEKAERVALEINTGMVQMNNAGYVKPTSPFGGCKASGMGREHGKFGFQELTQVKLISIEK